jgi:hypothetical protein
MEAAETDELKHRLLAPKSAIEPAEATFGGISARRQRILQHPGTWDRRLGFTRRNP